MAAIRVPLFWRERSNSSPSLGSLPDRQIASELARDWRISGVENAI
jgi:hypothetical protein